MKEFVNHLRLPQLRDIFANQQFSFHIKQIIFATLLSACRCLRPILCYVIIFQQVVITPVMAVREFSSFKQDEWNAGAPSISLKIRPTANTNNRYGLEVNNSFFERPEVQRLEIIDVDTHDELLEVFWDGIVQRVNIIIHKPFLFDLKGFDVPFQNMRINGDGFLKFYDPLKITQDLVVNHASVFLREGGTIGGHFKISGQEPQSLVLRGILDAGNIDIQTGGTLRLGKSKLNFQKFYGDNGSFKNVGSLWSTIRTKEEIAANARSIVLTPLAEVVSGKTGRWVAKKNFYNYGVLTAKDKLHLHANNRIANTGQITAQETLWAGGRYINNTGIFVSTAGQLMIATQELDNHGTIQSLLGLELCSEQFINSGRIGSVGSARIQMLEGSNDGIIESINPLQIAVEESFQNNGEVKAVQGVILQELFEKEGTLINTSGLIESVAGLSLGAGTIISKGKVLAEGDAYCQRGLFNEAKKIDELAFSKRGSFTSHGYCYVKTKKPFVNEAILTLSKHPRSPLHIINKGTIILEKEKDLEDNENKKDKVLPYTLYLHEEVGTIIGKTDAHLALILENVNWMSKDIITLGSLRLDIKTPDRDELFMTGKIFCKELDVIWKYGNKAPFFLAGNAEIYSEDDARIDIGQALYLEKEAKIKSSKGIYIQSNDRKGQLHPILIHSKGNIEAKESISLEGGCIRNEGHAAGATILLQAPRIFQGGIINAQDLLMTRGNDIFVSGISSVSSPFGKNHVHLLYPSSFDINIRNQFTLKNKGKMEGHHQIIHMAPGDIVLEQGSLLYTKRNQQEDGFLSLKGWTVPQASGAQIRTEGPAEIEANSVSFDPENIVGDALRLKLGTHEQGAVGGLKIIDQLKLVKGVTLEMNTDFKNTESLPLFHKNVNAQFKNIHNLADIAAPGLLKLVAQENFHNSKTGSIQAKNLYTQAGEFFNSLGGLKAEKKLEISGEKGVRIKSTAEVVRTYYENSGFFSGNKGFREEVKFKEATMKAEDIRIKSSEGTVEIKGAQVDSGNSIGINGQKGVDAGAFVKKAQSHQESWRWFGLTQKEVNQTEEKGLHSKLSAKSIDIQSEEGFVKGQGAKIETFDFSVYGDKGIQFNAIPLASIKETVKEGLTFNLFGLQIIDPASETSTPSFKGLNTSVSVGASYGHESGKQTRGENGSIHTKKASFRTSADAKTDLTGMNIEAEKMIADTKELALGGSQKKCESQQQQIHGGVGFDLMGGSTNVNGGYSQHEEKKENSQEVQVEIGALQMQQPGAGVRIANAINAEIGEVSGSGGASVPVHIQDASSTQSQSGSNGGFGFGFSPTGVPTSASLQVGATGGSKTTHDPSSHVDIKEGNLVTTETHVQDDNHLWKVNAEANISINPVTNAKSLGGFGFSAQYGDTLDINASYQKFEKADTDLKSGTAKFFQNASTLTREAKLFQENVLHNTGNCISDQKTQEEFRRIEQSISSVLHHTQCIANVGSSISKKYDKDLLNIENKLTVKFSNNTCAQAGLENLLGKDYFQLLKEAGLKTTLKGLRLTKIEKILKEQQRRGRINSYHMEQLEGMTPQQIQDHLESLGISNASFILKGAAGQEDHMVTAIKGLDHQWTISDGVKRNSLHSLHHEAFILVAKNTCQKESFAYYNRDAYVGKAGSRKVASRQLAGSEGQPTSTSFGDKPGTAHAQTRHAGVSNQTLRGRVDAERGPKVASTFSSQDDQAKALALVYKSPEYKKAVEVLRNGGTNKQEIRVPVSGNKFKASVAFKKPNHKGERETVCSTAIVREVTVVLDANTMPNQNANNNSQNVITTVFPSEFYRKDGSIPDKSN